MSLPNGVTGKRTIVLVALYLIFQIIIATYVADIFSDYSDRMPLDGQFLFNDRTAHDFMTALTLHGRNVHLLLNLIDMPFLILYTAAFTSVIIHFSRKAYSTDSWIFKLRFVPIIGGVSDFLENLLIIHGLLSYPQRTPLAMNLANIFVAVKYCFGPLNLILMISAILFTAIGYRKKITKN